MKQTELLIPDHWLSAIINGDETSFDYYDDPADYKAYQLFCRGEIGNGTVSTLEDESSFYHRHDASPYGVLPCGCVRCSVWNRTDTWSVEVTDTFGGEANYSWVRRESIEIPHGAPDRTVARMVKAAAGYTAARGQSAWLGETYEFRPRGAAVVLFANLATEAE